MRYFYDTEFIEDGRTIDLVSIGIVADDGREFYAVSSEFNRGRLVEREWLVENVLPSLPFVRVHMGAGLELALDVDHPDYRNVKPRWRIADDVYSFLSDTDEDIELWAYYGAYDHIALMQLWGAMMARPDRIPMWTHDIMQLRERVNMPVPEQASGHHNALDDARHTRAMWLALTGGAR